MLADEQRTKARNETSGFAPVVPSASLAAAAVSDVAMPDILCLDLARSISPTMERSDEEKPRGEKRKLSNNEADLTTKETKVSKRGLATKYSRAFEFFIEDFIRRGNAAGWDLPTMPKVPGLESSNEAVDERTRFAQSTRMDHLVKTNVTDIGKIRRKARKTKTKSMAQLKEEQQQLISDSRCIQSWRILPWGDRIRSDMFWTPKLLGLRQSFDVEVYDCLQPSELVAHREQFDLRFPELSSPVCIDGGITTLATCYAPRDARFIRIGRGGAHSLVARFDHLASKLQSAEERCNDPG